MNYYYSDGYMRVASQLLSGAGTNGGIIQRVGEVAFFTESNNIYVNATQVNISPHGAHFAPIGG